MDVGDVLAGRYELVEVLGAGGMGRVLRAHDRRLGRDVAVKLLPPHLLDDPAAVAQLREEARVSAAVRHPNVVQVLDAFLDDTDQPAIVMEYVDGPTLRGGVPAGGLSVEDALTITAAVGAGLQAVHDVGLVHRDVTPGNVLLDRGIPRLTDFGIARSSAAAAAGTTTVRGSVHYLAPEQAGGGAVDARADVYGLACLAVLLLTGQPPYPGEDLRSVVAQHLAADVLDVRSRRPEVSEAVATAVATALAKDPDRRPATVAAFLAAVGRPLPEAGAVTAGAVTALAGSGDATVAVEPDPTTVLGPVQEPGPPGRVGMILLGGGLTAAVVALVATLALGGGAPTPTVAASPAAVAPPATDPVPEPTAAPEPEPEPAPEPEPEPEPELTPMEAAVAAIGEQRSLLIALRGEDAITAKTLEKLDERLAKSLDELRDGKPRDASKELREFRKELADRVKDDEVTPAAEQALLEGLLGAEYAVNRIVDSGRTAEEDDDD